MERSQALKTFKSLNRSRMDRLILLAPSQHQLVIDLLPLLFHINSKLLPGYISDDVPFGIVDYRPDATTLDQAKKYRKGFSYRQRALRRYTLRGVYLLPEHGQLGYPDQPRYQVWLAHVGKLNDDQLSLLKQKTQSICEWAAVQGMTLQFHLFNVETLKQQSVNAQTLDLFYANGLVLAGAVPIWWLITPEEEQNYADAVEQLASQRLFNQNSVIDFGPIGQPDPTQCFTQSYQLALHTLQHGLSGIMPLLYQQYCLQQYPNYPSLSAKVKQQIYNGVPPTANDIALLKMAYLDAVLADPERELARRSLYAFSKEKLSQQVRNPAYPWRRDQLIQRVAAWGWSKEMITEQDNHEHSSYPQRFHEYQQISHQLKLFQQTLFDFAQQQGLDVKPQRLYIHRLQQIQLDPNTDVVMQLPPVLRPIPAQQLFIYRFEGNQNWFISEVELKDPKQNPLYQDKSLLHVLAWAIGNHILARTTWLKVADQLMQISIATVMELVQFLLRTELMMEQPLPDHQLLLQPPAPEQLLLTINLEKQPEDKLAQQGLQISSLQNDPFNYSSARYSLVNSIEGLLRCSWQQWHHFSHHGIEAPLALITSLLNWKPNNALRNQIQYWCPTPNYGTTISNRLARLLDNVLEHYLQYPEQGRYLISLSNRLYQLQWQHGLSEYHVYPARYQLNEALAESTTGFTPTYVDSYLDNDGLFNQLLRYQNPHQISVFLSFQQATIRCYLLDEFGRLLRQDYQDLAESTLISHLHRFFSAAKQNNDVERLRFYRLQQNRNNWQISPIAIQLKQQGYLPVNVVMEQLQSDSQCDIYCGQKHFQGRANDPELFRKVHELVLSLRHNNLYYPLYLTELKISSSAQLSAADYLLQKQKLERLLNPA